MPITDRTGGLVTLQNAATGASAGVTVANAGAESAIIEVSGTYTNLEATFEISIDGGVTFWPVNLEALSTGDVSGPKLTTPGLYKLGHASQATTHFRAPIAPNGTPTGSMTIKGIAIFG